ncbi:hypothetical protein TNCV_2153481 [Trichonephila clavipes]|nr:hypothetical protein TNCV_2153481 [Trichonephila clavipes]
MIDKDWRAVTSFLVHNCFEKSGLPTLNLMDVHDTLMKCNAEPSLGDAFPVQDWMFDYYAQIDTDISLSKNIHVEMSNAEIIAAVTANEKMPENDEDVNVDDTVQIPKLSHMEELIPISVF